MKKFTKIILFSALSLQIFATQSFAKTEGNYFGVDILKNSAKFDSASSNPEDNIGNNKPYYNRSEKNSAYGFGLNYKYAFNFNNFFIAPGISYEFLNNEKKSEYRVSNNNYFSQTIKLNALLSLRANFGYDINDQFSVYIPVGVSQFYYDFNTRDTLGNSYVDARKTDGESAAFVGFGFSYEPIKNIVMNLEYNKYQELALTSASPATFNDGQIKTKVNVDILKLGMAYRF